MDVLVTLPSTQAVLQAEQILTRRGVPFETVPQSLYKRRKCGLGIIFDEKYSESARLALAENHLQAEFAPLKK